MDGSARPSRCTVRCLARCRRSRACACSPAWTRRCPPPASTTSNSYCRAMFRPSRCYETVGAVLGAGWQSGKFLYVDTDLKIDLPEARVVLDRERLADLGLDLAGVGRELGTLLGGAYVNRFNYFDRSYKVIPQIGDKDRATVGSAPRSQDQDSGRPACAGFDVHAYRNEHRTAHAEPLPAAQRGTNLRRRQAGRHQGGRAPRARSRRGDGRRTRRRHRLRRRVATDPSRGICAHRHARVRGRAHLSRAGGAVPELSRPA